MGAPIGRTTWSARSCRANRSRPVVEADALEHGRQHLGACVARAGAQADEAAVGERRSLLDPGKRVGDREREVVVGVHAEGDLRPEARAHRRDTRADIVGQERAGAVHDVDALGPRAAMIAACSARFAGSVRWGIIRSPCTARPRSRASAMCCTDTSASVQCVAMRTSRAPRPAALLR